MKAILLFIFLFFNFSAKAGYQLTKSQLNILKSPYFKYISKDELYKTTYLKMEAFIKKIKQHHQIKYIQNEKEISKWVLNNSYCLGFDPLVMLALIYSESTFKINDDSPTGAIGPTQLTTVAIKEIRHQLTGGCLNKPICTYEAMEYFENTLNHCYSKNTDYASIITYDKLTKNYFSQNLEQNISLKEVKKDIKADLGSTCSAQREIGIASSTIIGFSLLKLYFAVNNKNLYETLAAYNGEEGDAKYNYAAKVMNYANIYSIIWKRFSTKYDECGN